MASKRKEVGTQSRVCRGAEACFYEECHGDDGWISSLTRRFLVTLYGRNRPKPLETMVAGGKSGQDPSCHVTPAHEQVPSSTQPYSWPKSGPQTPPHPHFCTRPFPASSLCHPTDQAGRFHFGTISCQPCWVVPEILAAKV